MNRDYTKVWNMLYSSKNGGEQIRFDQKKRVKAEERSLNQTRALICSEENSPDERAIWSRTHPRI